MKLNNLSLGLLILRKKKGKLHFIDLGGWADRNDLMINILRACLSENNIPDFPAVIVNTGDRPINKYLKFNLFSFATSDGYYDKIIPDWTYDSWMECKIPDFDIIIQEIEKAGENQAIKDQIGWIGNFKTSQSRIKLKKLGNKYPQYLDIRDSNTTEYMSLPDLVKTYKYLIDVEGNGFSGRLKYLFFSGRPVFVQDRIWHEYALIGAIPYKDYIPVKNDFSDLIEKIEKFFNSELVSKIGKSGQRFATENLNKGKAYEYTRNEFINLKKVRFNTMKVILFTSSRFISKLYITLINFIFSLYGKIKCYGKRSKDKDICSAS